MAETHEIIEVEKKPSDQTIKSMISKYFDEQASSYDELSEKIEKRRLYLHSIDVAIANKLKTHQKLERVLSIGCGTGARETKIQGLVGRKFEIVGVDPSSAMCKLAASRGLKVVNAFW